MSNPPAVGDDFRRKWNTAEYEKRAMDRIELDRKMREGIDADQNEKKESLKARDYKVDLDSNLNKTQVITKATPDSQTGGYYCNVCDCVVKDSINFLDHINGRKHQRNMGMSMKIKRSTLDDVKKRFERNKQMMEEERKKKEYDFDERVREQTEKDERERALKRQRRKAAKRQANEDVHHLQDDIDPALSSMMGFSGFGSSKK